MSPMLELVTRACHALSATATWTKRQANRAPLLGCAVAQSRNGDRDVFCRLTNRWSEAGLPREPQPAAMGYVAWHGSCAKGLLVPWLGTLRHVAMRSRACEATGHV